jgi:hypothetical protein
MIEPDIFAYLTDPTSATYALVGSRVYPLAIPQESDMPAIAYNRISNPDRWTQDGHHLYSPRYQFDCRGKVYDDALAVEDALVADLSLAGWGQIKKVHPAGAGPDLRDPDTGLFTRRVDLIFWH